MSKTKRVAKVNPITHVEEVGLNTFIINGSAGKKSFEGYTRRLAVKKYNQQYQKLLRQQQREDDYRC